MADPVFHGETVIVTRADDNQKGISLLFKEQGARVISLPTIEKQPLISESERIKILCQIQKHDWVVFTSPYAVEVLDKEIEFQEDCAPEETETPWAEPSTALSGKFALKDHIKDVLVAAVGPSTARQLENRGIQVTCIPNPHTFHYLPNCMGELLGKRVLLPRSQMGAKELPELLHDKGAYVKEIWTYTTVSRLPELRELDHIQEANYILFTSGTTVRGLFDGLQAHGKLNQTTRAKLACIGPSTASECQNVFGRVDLVAHPHTEQGLIETIINHKKMEKHHE